MPPVTWAGFASGVIHGHLNGAPARPITAGSSRCVINGISAARLTEGEHPCARKVPGSAPRGRDLHAEWAVLLAGAAGASSSAGPRVM